MRGWSPDPKAIDRRIDAALSAYLGHAPPAHILLAGVSQGADRAVRLARAFPHKYTKLVLLSTPWAMTASRLRGLTAAYFLVGEREDVWPTKITAGRWARAGIPVAIHVIAGGRHADLAGRGDPLMRRAFHYVEGSAFTLTAFAR